MNRTREIRDKLDYLVNLLEELQEAIPSSFQNYMGSPVVRRGCERFVQLTIECAGDICEMVAEHANIPLPNSLYESFVQAAVAGAFPRDVAQALAHWVRLRNRIVHDYERVDDAALYGSLAAIMEQFTDFTKHIRDFIGKETD